MIRPLAVLVLVAMALAVRAPAATTPTAPTGYDYLGAVKKLADPKWEGRGVGTAGIDSAAAYIASEMKRLGLKPGGEDGTYFQWMEVTTGVKVGEPCSVSTGKVHTKNPDELQAIGFSTNGTVRAPVVFAGYGITAPGYDYDDYLNIDAHDKLVLVLAQEPGEMDSTSRFDGSINTPHSELRTKAINAREHGALGLIVVNGPKYHANEPLPRPRSDGGGYMTSGLLAAYVSEKVADELMRGSGMTLSEAQRAIEAVQQPRSRELPDSASLTITLQRTRAKIRNVVGIQAGKDSARTIVIGAHYDHLGFGGESSLSPDSRLPHVGADDNASGVSVMLGAAATLANVRHVFPTHYLVFAAFTGEETGLIGSSHFTDDPPLPLESIETMINMDMVGRLRDNKLMVMGAGTSDFFTALLENVNQVAKFDMKTSSDGYGPSDHSSFYKRQIPVLHLFTGAHMDYHKPTDTWDKINADGLAKIGDFVVTLVDSLDKRPRPPYRKAESSPQGRIAGGGGYGAYLGTIPDYMQTEGGVLLSGVRTGSPAEQAGLAGGDVIVRFDGIRVDNIYDYTFALRSRKPGQQVRITVQRKGHDLDLVATLGRRP